MNANERDTDLLIRILDHADRIQACIRRFGDDFEIYAYDPDYQDAVKMNLFQIGECVNGLSDECKRTISMIPWHQIYGLRNIIAHGYIKIREDRIWHTVHGDLDFLQTEIKKYLSKIGAGTEL